jgi:hypothetical protein
MKNVALLSVLFAATNAFAAVDIRNKTCAQALAAIQRYELAEVIYDYHGRPAIYRLVSNGRYCAPGEDPVSIELPTKDNADCLVGYDCFGR